MLDPYALDRVNELLGVNRKTNAITCTSNDRQKSSITH